MLIPLLMLLIGVPISIAGATFFLIEEIRKERKEREGKCKSEEQ